MHTEIYTLNSTRVTFFKNRQLLSVGQMMKAVFLNKLCSIHPAWLLVTASMLTLQMTLFNRKLLLTSRKRLKVKLIYFSTENSFPRI